MLFDFVCVLCYLFVYVCCCELYVCCAKSFGLLYYEIRREKGGEKFPHAHTFEEKPNPEPEELRQDKLN